MVYILLLVDIGHTKIGFPCYTPKPKDRKMVTSKNPWVSLRRVNGMVMEGQMKGQNWVEKGLVEKWWCVVSCRERLWYN